MSGYPVCSKCEVAQALHRTSTEYRQLIAHLQSADLRYISDHARGYCHGQVSVAHKVIEDIDGLIPYVGLEAKIRVSSNKVL